MTCRPIVASLILLSSALSAQPPALKTLEERAQAEFQANNCAAAEKSFVEAISLAEAARMPERTGIYYMRLANCRVRIGDYPAGLDRYRRAVAIAEAAGNDELLETALHATAFALKNMGRVDEALPLIRRQIDLSEKCQLPAHRASALWNLAHYYGITGHLRDQIDTLNRALVAVRLSGDATMTATLIDTLGTAYISLGDLETAARLETEILNTPLVGITSMSTLYSRAGTYNNFGEIQTRAGRFAEARRSYERAVEGSTAPDRWHVHLVALLNLAGRQNAEGEFTRADAGFEEALKIADRVNVPDLRSLAWRMHSDDLLARKDVSAAIAAADQSLRIARGAGAQNRIFQALFSLGAAHAAAHDGAAARTDFDEAIGIAETIRAQSPGEVSDLNRAYANLVPLYQASVGNLLALHLPAEALRRAEEAKARVLMDILLRGGVDELSSLTPAEIAEQERLRKRLAVKGAGNNAGNGAGNNAGNGAGNNAGNDAMVDYRDFRRKLYTVHPELAVHSADFEAASPEQLSALITSPRTALLDYFVVPDGFALFVIRRSGVSTYLLADPKHTLAGEARSFRKQLAGHDLDYKTAARRLFTRLIAPALSALAGTTDWIVSPDAALWDVPFEALIDSSGRHLIETESIDVAPSLTALLAIRHRHQEAAGSLALLGLGNPLPSEQPLPDAAREVAAIGARYPKDSTLILTGLAATAAEFRDKAATARIIHLATHAGLNDIDPLSSWIRLGAPDGRDDGVVTALSLMSLHLHADMVVLSACETALGTTGPGEGMIGMGWALTAAGASSSVLTMWKVDSAASRQFMTAFYANLPRQSRAAALRKTALGMLQTPAWRHPFYWAAFTLQGDVGGSD